MIKNIIFDLGNVIINYDQQKIIDRFAKNDEEKEYLMEKNFKAPEWKRIDLGEITNSEAIEIINVRENYKYSKLTENFWQNWYKEQKINDDIVEVAKKLKDSPVSNYNPKWVKNLPKKEPVKEKIIEVPPKKKEKLGWDNF